MNRDRIAGSVVLWGRALLLAAALIAGGAGAALAQEGQEEEAAEPQGGQAGQEDEAQREVFVDEVFVQGEVPAIPTSNTVTAKLPLSLRETPASVSVVGSPVFEEQQSFILGDALRNASGVNVQTGNGVYDFFVVRGLDSVSSGLILFDGAPEPETSFYPVYNLEQVEVLKGPAAFLYGGSPLGGTVNMVRKQPVDGSFLRFGASGGSFSTVSGNLDGNLANSSDTLRFRFNSLWQSSDNYRDDKASEVRAINPALTWRPSGRTAINFNLERVEAEYKTDAGLPILLNNQVADVPRTRSYQSPYDISDQDILRFQVDVETRFSDSFVLRNKTYYRELEWDSRGTIFNGVFPVPVPGVGARDVLFRSLLSLDDTQEFVGNQLEGLWRFRTGNVTHNLLAGVEVARLADEFTFVPGFLPGIDLLNPVETAAGPVQPIPGQSFAADARTDVLAPYVVDQIVFGERFQLLVGARHDRLDFQDDATFTEREDSELSPMVGIVVSPSATLSLYASASEAFAPQSTFVVGEERVPEESRQVEAGVKKGALGNRLRWGVALYQIERENIAIPDDNGITQQTGTQRSRGAELEIATEPRPGTRTLFSYSYNDAELTEFTERVQVSFQPPIFVVIDHTGNRPAFAPEHIANLWVTQRLGGGFEIGLGGRYVSEQFIAENNAFAIDDYATVDAALYYDRGPWGLNLNFKNVTDEEYLTRGFGGTSVIPAAGFATYAGVHYNF